MTQPTVPNDPEASSSVSILCATLLNLMLQLRCFGENAHDNLRFQPTEEFHAEIAPKERQKKEDKKDLISS